MRLGTNEQRLLWAILLTQVTEEHANELLATEPREQRCFKRALQEIVEFRSEPSAAHAEGAEMRRIAEAALRC